FAALFLVLLRIAIGWHFLYEGISEVYSTPEGRDSRLAYILPRPPKPDKPEPPFSAEGYLRASSGPLAPYFRSLVPDVDNLEKLNQEHLFRTWRSELERYASYYKFDEEKRGRAEKALKDRVAVAEAWFRDPENAEKIKKYRDDLNRVDSILSS